MSSVPVLKVVVRRTDTQTDNAKPITPFTDAGCKKEMSENVQCPFNSTPIKMNRGA